MTLSVFLQQLVNGLTVGSLYALVAIGYTLVFGIIRLINFAHGDVFMMALYLCYLAISVLALPWYFAVALVILSTAVLGALIDRVAYKPLRAQGATTSVVMISAIGVSYFLQNLSTVLFTGKQKLFPRLTYLTEVVQVGSVTFQRMAIMVPIIAGVLLVALVLFVSKSKTGIAMRAVSMDMDTAGLMGIDVNRIILMTFFIGSGLAAVCAVFWGTKYLSVYPLAGSMPGMKAFICAVIGGIGNISGAVLGGFLLGMTETMIVAFFPTLTSYKDAVSFLFLIIVLLIRPTGIIREKIARKI